MEVLLVRSANRTGLPGSALTLTMGLLVWGFALGALATDFPPRDHGGADWVLADGDRVWGLHTNVGRFEIPAGARVVVYPYYPVAEYPYIGDLGVFYLEANTIRIDGTLDATGAGYTGGGGGTGRTTEPFLCYIDNHDIPCSVGSPSLPMPGYGRYSGFQGPSRGDGPFGGSGSQDWGGKDGGYGEIEINGDFSADYSIQMGSGGAGGGDGPFAPYGYGGAGAGGPGGGAIFMRALDAIDITGAISNQGKTGGDGGEIPVPECGYCFWAFRGFCFCNANGYYGGDGGDSDDAGSGKGGANAEDGGAGAGGGVLLYCEPPGAIRIPGSVNALGGRSQTSNGGTVKIFHSGGLVLHDAIQAGRLFTRDVATTQTTSVLFDYEVDAEDWQFVQSPGFDSPNWVVPPVLAGALGLAAVNNRSTFGYFESPPIFAGDTETPALLWADFQVSSTETDPTRVPQLRLRATSGDLTRSAALTIESGNDGAASPTPQGRRYSLPFTLPPKALPIANPFTLSFEMLNFNPAAAPWGDLILDAAEVTHRRLDTLQSHWRLDYEYAFEGFSNDGWTPSTRIHPFTSPQFITTGDALALRGTPDHTDVFGFWSSPADDIAIEPNRLYRATFRVESDVDAADRERVPQLRLRMNESGFRAGTFVAVESRCDGFDSPVAGQPRDYAVYFLPPPAADGRGLLLSFDFLNFDPEDLAGATLRLHDVRVESIATGEFPNNPH